MNMKQAMKKAYARHSLRLLSFHSPFKDFSWNRVRIALMNYEKSEATYIDNSLMVTFIYHRHAVILNRDGTGLLWNPWNEDKRPQYRLTMPKDVQSMVNLLWETHKAPIPINPKLN